MLLLQHACGMDPLLSCYTNDLVLLLQYGSGMDSLFSYFSVYLGIGMCLIILCWCYNMVLG